MFHHAMKSQERVMLPVTLFAATVLLSACGHHSTNSPPSTAGAPGSAAPVSAPHGSAAFAMRTAAIAKAPTISAPGSAPPMSAPQGPAASATQIATPAPTPAFKEVTPGQISVTLAPTIKPTIHTYPGVQADILGIRIGMTVAQAEAIAAKTYPGKPDEIKSSLSVNSGGISAQSQPFISEVVFQNGTNDVLTANFTNPTTGNVLYGVGRRATFKDASKQPLIASVSSGLMSKYGHPSDPFVNRLWWQFGEQSLKPCNLDQCGHPGKNVVMEIYAQLDSGSGDRAKVMFLTIGMDDYQLQRESTVAGNSQLMAAAGAEQAALAKQVVPTQALTGTYVTTADTKPAGSIHFVSGTMVNVYSGDNKVQTTYKINGHQLLIDAEHGNVTFTIDNNGCLDGPDNSTFCKK